jgi:hypothetical protein
MRSRALYQPEGAAHSAFPGLAKFELEWREAKPRIVAGSIGEKIV